MEMYGWVIGFVVLLGAGYAIWRSKQKKHDYSNRKGRQEDGPPVKRK